MAGGQDRDAEVLRVVPKGFDAPTLEAAGENGLLTAAFVVDDFAGRAEDGAGPLPLPGPIADQNVVHGRDAGAGHHVKPEGSENGQRGVHFGEDHVGIVEQVQNFSVFVPDPDFVQPAGKRPVVVVPRKLHGSPTGVANRLSGWTFSFQGLKVVSFFLS